MRELSCHAIEFQGSHREKLFQLVPARSGLWTRSSCKVSILWRIPQYSPKKLNLNKSLSIHIFVGSVSIHSVWGVEKYSTSACHPWERLSKLHWTSSTIRWIFTYHGWVWTARFIDDLTITVPDSWQSITTLRLSFTCPGSNSTHFRKIWCPDKNPNLKKSTNETYVLIFGQNETCPNC